MAKDGYLIGESVLNRLRAVVQRVEGTPGASQITRIATANDEGPPYYVPRQLIVGNYTGVWSIGDTNSVLPLGVESTEQTVSVTNVLFDMPDQGTVPCVIGRQGTAWHLIDVRHTFTDVVTNVSLGTAGLVFTRLRVQVASTATASSVTIGTTACT